MLSLDALAKLNAQNQKADSKVKEKVKEKVREKENYGHRRKDHERPRKPDGAAARRKRKNRYSTAPLLEEGRAEKVRYSGLRGGGDEIYEKVTYRKDNGKRKKRCLILVIVIIVLLLIILIPVGVLVIGKNNGSSSSTSTTSSSSSSSSSSGASLPDENTIPTAAKGTILDPYTWLDTTDFNTTYTNETVGGLSVMGLNSTWDDTAQANPNVPKLNEKWSYGDTPIRGVNLGGWLELEPFITPSLFNSYSEKYGIVDEYTLSEHLGSSSAADTIESHYSTWVTEQTFSEIAAAGLDHVRIPYPYWAVTTYDGDPYVPKIAWRYLLRGIEWARKYGLRVNLDLHSLPGSQNGMNHSGRQGVIGWINGTDGSLNAQRSLDIHDQLSQFFAQKRYENVVTIYGLCNEPKMLSLGFTDVIAWNKKAIKIIRDNGMDKYIIFGDGFESLTSWKDRMTDVDSKLIMDTHQYMIFNTGQLAFTHQNKVELACDTWSEMLTTSLDTSSGWGPILNGEWSQADTDCATYLNNVNMGTRWEGTLEYSSSSSSNVLTPTCPYKNSTCDCTNANADASDYSDEYKDLLLMLAEAQMYAFEQVWGWFYWTWDTESTVQWSWKKGIEAGILPKLAYEPSFKCNESVPDFEALGLSEAY